MSCLICVEGFEVFIGLSIGCLCWDFGFIVKEFSVFLDSLISCFLFRLLRR